MLQHLTLAFVPDMFSILKPVLLAYLIPLVPVLLVVALIIVKMSEPKKEDYEPDPLLALKTGLYMLQIFAVHSLVLGVFTFIDWPLSKITSESLPFEAVRSALATVLGSAAMLFLLEMLLIKLDVKKNYLPRRLMYAVAIFLFGFIGTLAAAKFLGAIIEWPKGSEFHMPLAATLVYMPVFVMGCLYYKAEFSEEKEVQTFLPASIVNKADQVMAQVPGANAAGFGAMNAYGQQQQQPMADYGAQPMAQQPMAQQPMAQQPMAQQPVVQQPMAQQYSQPVAQQPAAAPVAAAPSNACPSCGQPARFIAQYNRNWCDTCQKYL